MIEIHAYHGWGYDSRFWDPIKSILPNHILFKSADRGYFGGECILEFEEKSKPKVLLLHSFGLHWCSPEQKKTVDIIIILNGFKTFHPVENLAKSRSKKILKGMIAQFKKEPDSVLKAFYENCFSPFKFIEPSLNWKNRALLLKDLTLLDKAELGLTKDTKADWLIIDSDKDKIVPGKRGQELLDFLGSDKYENIKDGVHAFPATNPGDCIKILSQVFPIFNKDEKHISTSSI